MSVQFCTQDWSKWLLLLREQGGAGNSTCHQCQPRRAAPLAGGVEVSTVERTSRDESELASEHYEVSDRIP